MGVEQKIQQNVGTMFLFSAQWKPSLNNDEKGSRKKKASAVDTLTDVTREQSIDRSFDTGMAVSRFESQLHNSRLVTAAVVGGRSKCHGSDMGPQSEQLDYAERDQCGSTRYLMNG